MSTRRVLKAAEAVREAVSWAILAELNDPRVQNVTVTRVEMSGDLRLAKVYVSIMGDEKTEALSLRGLQSSTGFLQSKLSDRIDTRYTPKIEFMLDKGLKNAIEISRILDEELRGEEKDEELCGEEKDEELRGEEKDESNEMGTDEEQVLAEEVDGDGVPSDGKDATT